MLRHGWMLVAVALVTFCGGRGDAAQWSHAATSQGIAYFAFPSPLTVERYDMSAQVWLAPIALTGSPSAFTVDADGMYVAYATGQIARISHSGVQTVLATQSAQHLAVAGNLLFAVSGSQVRTLHKNTGAQLDDSSFFYSMIGHSVAPQVSKLFGRSSGVSPSDIIYIQFTAGGMLTTQDDSPYHGDYPGANQTWVLPGGAHVADNAGIVYSTADLTYVGSLGGTLDDLSAEGSDIVVLRGNTLHRVSAPPVVLPQGELTLATTPEKIFLHGGNVFLFNDGVAQLVTVSTVAVATIMPPQPGPPVDANGLVYSPDQVILGNDGTLYLLSKAWSNVFRWSWDTGAYLTSIPLAEAPDYMAYSGVTNRLYFTYASGLITQVKLDQGHAEQPFALSPQTPLGLATAGEYVFVCDPTGAWVSHFTYSPSGVLISQEEWNYPSASFEWNAVNRKIYHFRDGTSPNDLLWEDIDVNGVIGNQVDSPYHSSAGIQHPIRVHPNGSVVVLGSGRVYNAFTLEQIDQLSNSIDDAAWYDNTLYTLISSGGSSEVQTWFPTYALNSSQSLPGAPIRIIGHGNGLLAITSVGGIPNFTLVEAAQRFDRSDCNGDGSSNLVDAVGLLDYLFNSGAAPLCFRACDASDDGSVNLQDVVVFLSALFGVGGTTVPDPYLECGNDWTTDPLICDNVPTC